MTAKHMAPFLDDGDVQLCACGCTVRRRDGFHCTECGSAQDLHVHHLRGWAEYPAGRLDAANAVTLCSGCHILRHSNGGDANE